MTIRGGTRLGTAPADVKTLVSFDSVPLTEVITSINKYSNNVMARHLLLTLGVERFGPPATVEKGKRVADMMLAFNNDTPGLARNLKIRKDRSADFT